MTQTPPLPEQEIHDTTRRWSGVAVLMIVLLALAPMWTEFRAVLRVGPLDTIPSLGSVAFLIAVAYVAFYSEHVPRSWYRAVDLVETITAQTAFLYLTYASGNAVSFFWILHFSYIFFMAASPIARATKMASVGIGPAVLAAAFMSRGDTCSAIFCVWAAGSGLVEFWLLKGLMQRLASTMDKLKQTEGALAQTKLELERQRIARDLHDGVGSELAALLWQMRQLHLELAGELPRERVTHLLEHTRRSLVGLRSVVWSMRAPARSWSQTVDRLRRHLDQACAGRVRLEFSAPRSGGEVPGEVCLHLERFAQEAAHNALRHARASRLRVELTFGPTLRAMVEDDGVGLPEGVAAISEGGLRNLRTRLESVGGELAIEACSPGTRLSASFPLTRALQTQPRAA